MSKPSLRMVGGETCSLSHSTSTPLRVSCNTLVPALPRFVLKVLMLLPACREHSEGRPREARNSSHQKSQSRSTYRCQHRSCERQLDMGSSISSLRDRQTPWTRSSTIEGRKWQIQASIYVLHGKVAALREAFNVQS